MDPQEPVQRDALREVEGDLRAELHQVRAQMKELTHQHQRAVAMRRIFEHDPLTRERFTMLHDNIDQYPGKMAELREQERLLTRWLDRCRALLSEDAA
ncbi:MAG TPA: hypothetical protein VET65_01660 [Candidatus Limnocylindrales bacterium]|nr:hypothetical protein [Candidatus Limnocylindrales bacterium]